MSQDHRDIVERLVDFDHCGGTATERVKMRMDAWNEIRTLRAEVARLRATALNTPSIELTRLPCFPRS
jgi:hypothetical protein